MQKDSRTRYIDHAMFANRRYKIALSGTIVLLAFAVTIAVLVLIFADARQESRETEFETTLTALFADLALTQAAANASPLIGATLPPLTPGSYPFVVRAGDPRYSRPATCTYPRIRGEVRDLNGALTDAYQVQVWGDALPLQIVLTGEPAGQPAGSWQVTLNALAHRRVWVQLSAGGRYYSAPVEVVFAAGVCDRAQATIVFEQGAPLG